MFVFPKRLQKNNSCLFEGASDYRTLNATSLKTFLLHILILISSFVIFAAFLRVSNAISLFVCLLTCWKARTLTSLQLRNLAFNILGLLCKSKLRFDSCDITFTSKKEY